MLSRKCKKKAFHWVCVALIFASFSTPTHAEDSKMDSETFELQYAQAVVAAQDGNHTQSLSMAEALAKQFPNNLDVIQLLVQEAWTTGNKEVLDQAIRMRTIATQRAKLREKLEDQLKLVEKELSSGRLKRARERLDNISRQMSSGISLSSVQGHLFLLANALYQRSYFSDAFAIYQQIVTLNSKSNTNPQSGDEDPEAMAVSLIMIERLKKRNFFLMGTLASTYDSNPWGLPSGSVRSDGTPNNDQSTLLKVDFTLRGPATDANPLYYSVYANTSDYRSLAQGGRAQFDTESLALGLGAGWASIFSGRAQLRYLYQYSQSPFPVTSSTYSFSPVSRTHYLNLDFTRDLASQVEVNLNAHAYLAKYVTPNDLDINDRSGNTLGFYSEAVLHMDSLWLTPLLRFSLDRLKSEGSAYTNSGYALRAGDYFRFFSGKGNGLLYFEANHAHFDQYPGGRSDKTYRINANIDYSLSSVTRLFVQEFYNLTQSTVDYYTQNHFVLSTGLTFSLEN